MLAVRSLRVQAPRIGRYFASVAVEAPPGSYLPADVVQTRVLKVLKGIKYCPSDITLEHKFTAELEFDSGILKEIHDGLSNEFCIPLTEAERAKFIDGAAAVSFFTKHPKAR